MKKLVLVLVLVLAFALPVLANPFVDVPLNHWAYDSVQSLAAKGVIVGYPDGTFGGGKSLTRYEFAEATAKALAYVEGMDFAAADDVAILEKLAIEFADELASLGVTVADLEAALGEHTEAIDALEATVAKLDTFFEPVVISGTFTADYTKVVVPMTVATLSDEAVINIVATINPVTTAGITVTATDVLSGAPAYTILWDGFFIDYQGADLQLRVGNVEPATIGLGLVFASDDFDGFLATWVWDAENDLGDWTLFGDVEDYYTANIGFALGDEDEVAVGVTGSYDVLASGYAGSLDLAFALGEDDEAAVAVEAGVFYDTVAPALTYAGALTIGTSLDDLTLDIDAHYVQAGFVPTMSDFTDDRFGGGVEVGYLLTDELDATLIWTYDMDTAMAVQTHTAEVDLLYTVDADTEETADINVTYNVLTAAAVIKATYMNYPLTDDFVFSGIVAYDYPAATYAGVATLGYALATDMALTVEGRVDSDGAAFWSTEVELVYTLDTNTALTVGYEQNTWSDDLKDYDAMTVSDTLGTLTAGLEVTF